MRARQPRGAEWVLEEALEAARTTASKSLSALVMGNEAVSADASTEAPVTSEPGVA